MGKKQTRKVVVAGKRFPKELVSALDTFLEDLAGKKHSPKTIKKRKSGVMRFIEYLDRHSIKRWQDVTPSTIDDYRIEILDQGYSPHSICSFLQSMKMTFTFMEDRAILFDNPTRDMIITKPKPELGLVLTQQEIRDLLAQPDLTTPHGVRDRAIIETFYGAGVRLGECAAITIYDVDVDNQTVTVTGKGSKQRIIPIGRHAAKYLGLYLRDARKRLLRDDLPPEELWLGRGGGRPLGAATLRQIIKRHADAADLPEETDTHCLRRTCATHMLRGGAHPVAVAQMLGHSDLSSLAHYLKTTIADLKNTHEQSNPGA